MHGLTRWLAIGLLALVTSTWKLWTPQAVFPQVPLIRAACDWPGWLDWGCLAVLVASALTMLFVARRGWLGRGSCLGLAVSLSGFFVLDQHRLQPWAWQFFLLAVLLSLADDDTARRGWRWLVIGIYFWSAVSKLDYTFCHEQGPALLEGLRRAMGLRGLPNAWTEALDIVGSLGIALSELGVAVLLAWPRARWLGLWAATTMHVALLAALGPLGLNHSLGVLLWNAFFLVQNWLLFRATAAERPVVGETFPAQMRQWWRDLVIWPTSRTNRLALGTILAAMTWPVLEPLGYCDHWLAWAVYSARAETVHIIAIDTEKTCHSNWEPIRLNGVDLEAGKTLDISGRSLGVLGVPICPHERFQIGVTSALLQAERIHYAVVTVNHVPQRVTGKVSVRRFLREELLEELDRHTINAHPRMATYGTTPK
ncbi:MAG: hypothetical protein NTZ32_15655 [Planctomycetales bacterium]|nr:hypothetical protein [Planctomycetales bacterium]